LKNITNSRLFSTFLFFLTVLVIAKLVWLIVSVLFLPKSGVDYSENSKLKAFYYPIRLSNSQKEKRVVTPIKATVVAPKKVVIGNMKDYHLLALYNASDALVVTVAKGAKTKVLARGESFNGFKLKSAGKGFALFTKNGKEHTLFLKNIKPVKNRHPKTHKRVSTAPHKLISKKGIVSTNNGETKVVSKGLLSSYTKDIDKVWKDIGIGEHKVNGVLTGFKVNFIKRGSDFEKLGLRRGDILTAINGQELDSYNAAFSFYKEMDSIENLTLSIKRNNQDMELEYEIQ